MMPKSLKGYSKTQRVLAERIRFDLLRKGNFGYDTTQAERLRQRICDITSPMFFIKFKERLFMGEIAQCLSEYSEQNYNRRAGFIQGRK